MVNSQVIYKSAVFKLPTWAKGDPKFMESQFKLRFFVLTANNTLSYYTNEKSYQEGKAALGSVEIGSKVIVYERINKVDLVLVTENRRLWLRNFSEHHADAWERAIGQMGVMHPQEEKD